MDLTTAVVMFVLFMVAIYANYRIGYREGVYEGYEFGVYEMVVYLMATGKISGELSDGTPATAKQMTEKLMEELNRRRPELKFEDETNTA